MSAFQTTMQQDADTVKKSSKIVSCILGSILAIQAKLILIRVLISLKEIQLLLTRKINKLEFGHSIYSIYSRMYYDKPNTTDDRIYIICSVVSTTRVHNLSVNPPIRNHLFLYFWVLKWFCKPLGSCRRFSLSTSVNALLHSDLSTDKTRRDSVMVLLYIVLYITKPSSYIKWLAPISKERANLWVTWRHHQGVHCASFLLCGTVSDSIGQRQQYPKTVQVLASIQDFNSFVKIGLSQKRNCICNLKQKWIDK